VDISTSTTKHIIFLNSMNGSIGSVAELILLISVFGRDLNFFHLPLF
jgi:hypothetical protein